MKSEEWKYHSSLSFYILHSSLYPQERGSKTRGGREGRFVGEGQIAHARQPGEQTTPLSLPRFEEGRGDRGEWVGVAKSPSVFICGNTNARVAPSCCLRVIAVLDRLRLSGGFSGSQLLLPAPKSFRHFRRRRRSGRSSSPPATPAAQARQ